MESSFYNILYNAIHSLQSFFHSEHSIRFNIVRRFYDRRQRNWEARRKYKCPHLKIISKLSLQISFDLCVCFELHSPIFISSIGITCLDSIKMERNFIRWSPKNQTSMKWTPNAPIHLHMDTNFNFSFFKNSHGWPQADDIVDDLSSFSGVFETNT